VPKDWRKADGTHIFKKRKKEDPGYYRLVSFTSVPGKVMEHLILETISRNMKCKTVTRSSQFDFSEGKSCLTFLINFYNETVGLVDKERTADIICLDFRKAFDTFSRKRSS